MKRFGHAGLPRDGLGMAPLSEGDLQDIHLASLEVLERTGMWVEADDAIDVFADGGCRVDRDTRMVRLPPAVVEEPSAPRHPWSAGAAGTPSTTSSSAATASRS